MHGCMQQYTTASHPSPSMPILLLALTPIPLIPPTLDLHIHIPEQMPPQSTTQYLLYRYAGLVVLHSCSPFHISIANPMLLTLLCPVSCFRCFSCRFSSSSIPCRALLLLAPSSGSVLTPCCIPKMSPENHKLHRQGVFSALIPLKAFLYNSSFCRSGSGSGNGSNIARILYSIP